LAGGEMATMRDRIEGEWNARNGADWSFIRNRLYCMTYHEIPVRSFLCYETPHDNDDKTGCMTKPLIV
jgi:hypothetical protein